MEKFLETVASYIYSLHKVDMQDICIIFPNRRAGTFFNAYLQNVIDRPLIGPKVTTVNEFIHSFSDTQIPDKLKLIAELFEMFKSQSGSTETFDEFYFWGEVLLADFNDIDLYLADPAVLYKNLVGLKEIESRFDFLDESQKEILKRFWGSLGKWEEFKNQEAFIKLWKLLEPTYFGFKEKLQKNGIAYDGLVFREIAEKIKSGQGLPLDSAAYYIIGLNALNECEKVVFKYLKSEGKAVFLWDYDRSYLDDLKNKAGYFIRENLVAFPPPDDFKPQVDCFSSPKKIEFISVASLHGQAQVIAQTINSTGPTFDNTAIVLADESLLFPVLGAIPETIGSVNITMGYPVKNSAVFGFILLLGSLIKNARFAENQSCSFYYRFVFDILNHQLLGGIESEKVGRFVDFAKKSNRIYLNPADLDFSEIHRLIFAIPQTVAGYGPYFRDVLKLIFEFLQHSQPENKILPELIVSVYNAVEKLETTIAGVELSSGQTIGAPVFFKLFNQYLSQVSVSFEGEPLSGLQVMGILETRCLDFENVFIIGLNEDLWPRPANSPSLIPYNLRYVFGLPSSDNHEAIYAYYFYRLVQRPSNITASFNTLKDGVNSGELSRFGLQLIYDSGHPACIKNFEYKVRSNPTKTVPPSGSEILTNTLLARFTIEHPLSPSALNMYLTCRYKFYLHYIADLPEGEEMAEEVDSRLFGNIFHKSAEMLYSLAEGRATSGWIDRILNDKNLIRKIIDKAFFSEYFKSGGESQTKLELEGNLKLTYGFIRSYLIQLLKVDRVFTPFDIVALEKRFTWETEVAINGENRKIPVGGTIDRLDRVGGRLRVIDYKTGFVNPLAVDSIESVFDQQKKSRKKEAFQAFLYTLILKKGYFKNEEITPGIYILRNLYTENFTPNFTFNKKELCFDEVSDEFESHFITLLHEVFSAENTFHQTTFTNICTTCPYKVICHRS